MGSQQPQSAGPAGYHAVGLSAAGYGEQLPPTLFAKQYPYIFCQPQSKSFSEEQAIHRKAYGPSLFKRVSVVDRRALHEPFGPFGWWAGGEIVKIPLLKHYTEQPGKPFLEFKAELQVGHLPLHVF